MSVRATHQSSVAAATSVTEKKPEADQCKKPCRPSGAKITPTDWALVMKSATRRNHIWPRTATGAGLMIRKPAATVTNAQSYQTECVLTSSIPRIVAATPR